jgi:hypothetical protein
MPANTSPIYTLTPNIGTATITASTTANTKSDGTGTIATDILKAFTSGANGSFIEKVQFSANASAAATATTPTTLRVFLSTVSSSTTANTNTWLLGELSAAAQTADHSTNATFSLTLPLNIRVSTGYYIHVSTHVVAAANTSWQAIVFGGDY